jgi:site-specific DNA-methyltransferase (adenine-specific)
MKLKKGDATHEFIQDDAIGALKQLKENSVDLAFADPPYNIGKEFGEDQGKRKRNGDYIEWCQNWIDEIRRVVKPDGSFYLMAATQYMPRLDIYCEDKFHIVNRIVWYYDSSGRQAKTKFGSRYEPILLCVNDKNNYTFNYEEVTVKARTGAERELIDYRKDPPEPYNDEKNPGNVWEFPRVRYRMPEYIDDHPSQKPELLLERIVRASSNPGDTVLDPFAGTFTTNAVCAKLERNSIGIEIEEQYINAGYERIKEIEPGDEISNKHNHEEDTESASLDDFS